MAREFDKTVARLAEPEKIREVRDSIRQADELLRSNDGYIRDIYGMQEVMERLAPVKAYATPPLDTYQVTKVKLPDADLKARIMESFEAEQAAEQGLTYVAQDEARKFLTRNKKTLNDYETLVDKKDPLMGYQFKRFFNEFKRKLGLE